MTASSSAALFANARYTVASETPACVAMARTSRGRDVRDSPSRVRRRQDVVARYWQRYCSKNDTIGFFGPLAWGRFSGTGEAVAARVGAVALQSASGQHTSELRIVALDRSAAASSIQCQRGCRAAPGRR